VTNRTRFATFVAALAVLPFCVDKTHAQGSRTPHGVAVIDMAYIFKNYTKFQAMKNAMKGDVERAEAELKGMHDEIGKLEQRLRGGVNLTKGSPEYKELESHLARRRADLALKMQEGKKTFLEREAKIYYIVYQEVADEVKFYSQQNNISLVLRFKGDPVDSAEPQEVLNELNKAVIYYNKNIDITPIILDAVNRRQPAQVGGNQRQPQPRNVQVPRRPGPAQGTPRRQ